MRAPIVRFLITAAFFPIAPVASAADDAAELYHQYCSVCHGDKGDGRSRARQGLVPPPRDFTMPGLGDALTRQRMIDVVMNGKPGTAMVGWKRLLDQTKSAAVVDYVREKFMRHTPGAATAATDATRTAYVRPPKGHATSGRALYENNCATCHGAGGHGDGPRAYFIVPRPRNFYGEDARAYTPETLFVSVKHGVQGREMPAWGTVLTDQQVADVSQYVYETFVRADRAP